MQKAGLSFVRISTEGLGADDRLATVPILPADSSSRFSSELSSRSTRVGGGSIQFMAASERVQQAFAAAVNGQLLTANQIRLVLPTGIRFFFWPGDPTFLTTSIRLGRSWFRNRPSQEAAFHARCRIFGWPREPGPTGHDGNDGRRRAVGRLGPTGTGWPSAALRGATPVTPLGNGSGMRPTKPGRQLLGIWQESLSRCTC